jgi:hypothetical protein
MTVNGTANASAAGGASGQTFVFAFQNNGGTDFASGSQVVLTIPAGWTEPQTTNAAGPGYVAIADSADGSCTPSLGTAPITGSGPWTITVAQTCRSGGSMTITYGAGSSTENVTPPVATGQYKFTTLTSHGSAAPTEISSSPTITVDTLAITFYKEICARYTDVPANINPTNVDQTGWHGAELDTSYQTGDVNPATDIPAACAPASGWSFQLRRGSGGALIETVTTGSDGTYTAYIGPNDLAGARGTDPSWSGVWIYEVTRPDAGFGALRCYQDHLNGDNEDYVRAASSSVNQTYCIAYNVAGPGISLTKTASPSTYALGDPITYTYTVINTSNVNTGSAQFSVTDDKLGVFPCGTPQDLVPDVGNASDPTAGSLAKPSAGSFVTCTNTHAATQTDIDNGSIVNHATASYTLLSKTYNSNTASAKVTAKPTLTITAKPQSKTYGTALDLSTLSTTGFTVSGLAPGDGVDSVTLTSDGAAADGTAGSHSITPSAATGTGLDHYNIVYTAGTLTVNAAVLTVTAENKSHAYGTALPALTYTITGYVNSEDSSVVSGAPVLGTTATPTSPISGSPYIITITQGTLAAANYTFIMANGELTVTQAAITIAANNQTKTYGTALNLGTTAYTVTSGSLSNAGDITGVTLTSIGAPAGAAVGTYPIAPSLAVGPNAANYTIAYANGQLAVGQAPSVVTVTCSPTSVAYTGAAQTPCTATVTGDGLTTINVPAASLTFANNINAGTVANPTASASYTWTGDANHTGNTGSATFTITPAAITITANNQTKTYGTALNLGTTAYTVTSGSLINAGDITGVTLTSTGAAAGAAVGTYPIAPSLAVGPNVANYTITYANGQLAVNAAAATVKITCPASVEYTGSAIAPCTAAATGAGLGTGRDVSSFIVYSNNVQVGTAGASITWSDANHAASSDAGSFQITPIALTITAADQTKTYGDTFTFIGHEFSITSGSLVGTDSISAITLNSAGAFATASAAGSPYAIVPSNAVGNGLGNYSITYANGLMTVLKADTTITIICPASVAYTGSAITPCTASADGPTYSTPVDISDLIGYVGNTDVGFAGATVLWPGDPDHLPSIAGTSFQITPLALTITASDQTKSFGDTFTFTGHEFAITTGTLVGTDSIDSVTLTSPGADASAGVAGSPYAITPSGAVGSGLDNYSITYADGPMFINPAAATVKISCPASVQYTGSAITPCTATVTGPGFGSGLDVTSDIGYVGNTNIGGADAIVIWSGDPNHTGGGDVAGFQITPIALTITAKDQTKAYGQTFSFSGNEFSITSGTLLGGDSIDSVTLNSAGAHASATVAGSPYSITATGATGTGVGNYAITYADGQMTVTPLALTLTANDQSKTYGQTFAFTGNEFKITSGSLLGSDSIDSVTLNSAGAAASASVAGSLYSITATGATGTGASNYDITYADGQMTVGPAALQITASSATIGYGDSIPDITPIYAGLVGGDTKPATEPTCSTTATDTSSVGPYPSTCKDAADPDYTITYVGGTVTIDNMPTLHITASSDTMTYGGTVPTITAASITGFVKGDTAASLSGLTCVTDATSSSPVGGYTSSCSGAVNANYNFDYINGTVQVTKADLTITPTNRAKPFGTTLNLGTTGFGTSGLVNGDSVTGVTLASSGTPASAVVGPYDIDASGATGTGLGNYAISYGTGTLTVTERLILTVTANDQSRDYSNANPILTFTITGYADGDGISALTTLPTCTSDADAASLPGNYQITCSGAVADAYDFNYVSGTLKVTGQIVDPATGKPVHTPPTTSTGSGPNGDNSTPLFVLLICLAFSGLGLLAVQAQRKSIRS